MKSGIVQVIGAIAILLIGMAIGAAWKGKARLAESERESAGLRQELEARDSTIAEMQTTIENLQSRAPKQLTTSRAQVEAEVQQRLAEAARLQSNAAQLVGALTAAREAPEAPETPEYLEKRTQASIEILGKHVKHAEEKATALNARMKELLTQLNIPEEIASLEPRKGLASASLQQYWPYFEAKKEAEMHQMIVDRLKMRTLQENIEAEILEAQRKKP
jgi:hypothetical protein